MTGTEARAAGATPMKNRSTLIALVAGLLMLLTLSAWAVASPVGSSPDEDFHLASVWCGAGERAGLCGPGNSAETRMVPDNIERAICYAHESKHSAKCQGETFLDGSFGLVESSRVNGDGLYPSGYFFWTAQLAGDNMVLSVIAMRLAQALLFTVLSVGLWLLLPRDDRFAYVGSIAATFVPFGLFLIPSINPSGWAIASSAMLLPALVGFFRSSGWRSWALGAYAVLAALMGLSARADSSAYTALAVIAAVVITFEPGRRSWLRAALPIALILMSVIAFFGGDQTSSALGGGMAIDDAEKVPARALIFINLMDLPELLLGVIGQNFDSSPYRGLGWLDTPLPALAWVPTTLVIAGVVFVSLGRMDRRRAITLLGLGAAMIVIPLYLLVRNEVTVGWQVQPRYIMPLVIMFVAALLMPTGGGTRDECADRPATRPLFGAHQMWLGAALLSVANGCALYVHMQRYIAPREFGLDASQGWWWRAGPQPLLVWIIGTFAFAGLLCVIAWCGSRGARAVPAPQRDQVDDGAEQGSASQGEHDSQFEPAERSGGQQRE